MLQLLCLFSIFKSESNCFDIFDVVVKATFKLQLVDLFHGIEPNAAQMSYCLSFKLQQRSRFPPKTHCAVSVFIPVSQLKWKLAVNNNWIPLGKFKWCTQFANISTGCVIQLLVFQHPLTAILHTQCCVHLIMYTGRESWLLCVQ